MRKERGDPMQDRRRREPPQNGSPRLTQAAVEGGGEEGNPSPSSVRQRCASGAWGGAPTQTTPGPPRQMGTRSGMGAPRPSRARKPRADRREGGTDHARSWRAGRVRERGRTPLYGSMRYQSMACPTRRGGTPRARQTSRQTMRQGTDCARLRRADRSQMKGGTLPSGSKRSQRTACPSGRGGSPGALL